MRTCLVLLALIGLPAVAQESHIEPARVKGWSWKLPPDLVRPESNRRNHVFYVGEPVRFTLGPAALTYEVRDYQGEVVDSGQARPQIQIKPQPPGWYKLYLYGKPHAPAPEEKTRKMMDLWGDAVGGTMFCVFRNDPRFPRVPAKDVSGGSVTGDEVMRGVVGMGPQRHSANADQPDQSIASLEKAIAIDREMYLPYDPARKRSLLIAFPNGTKNLQGVRKIVEHFKKDVQYWEARNEPNYAFGGGGSGAQKKPGPAEFVEQELKPFYQLVKSVDPGLKVIGPGTVSINPSLQKWIEAFLQAGGGKYIDAFSFHAYNTVNGDLWLAREAMDSLNRLLRKYGLEQMEKWQTEQGYFAAEYGVYAPAHQGRWTMLEMMVYEQYGIPKEHNHLWYDVSHGFWDFPTWWENDDGSLNPAAPLMRVWSEELFGKTFAKALDFGSVGNRLYIGSVFAGTDGSVAAIMSNGLTDGRVALRTSAAKVKLVGAFGVERELPVSNGQVVVDVPELPVYVEVGPGQDIEAVPEQYGKDVALEEGVIATSSGTGKHPVDPKIDNDIHKLINGQFENWYWTQKRDAQPWMDDTAGFPAWVELRLPRPTSIGRVIVYAAPPWQWQGTLLDFEVQVEEAGQWVTKQHIKEPARTLGVFTPATRTSVDTFFSDRWIFNIPFPASRTSKVRVLVHDCTFGGGATPMVAEAGGQTGPHHIMLREIEIYAK